MRQIVGELSQPQMHLAVDEAALVSAPAEEVGESIRIWRFDRPVVIAGRSTRVDVEIDRAYCEANAIPILRRCSGGATVVAGPGCLMYSVVLSTAMRPELRNIDAAHRFVIERLVAAARQQKPEIQHEGICDLTLANRKCSGNSLRVTRDAILYHGTLLTRFDLDLIARSLKAAPRQPEYRQNRSHAAFVTNVDIMPERFEKDLCDQFNVSGEISVGTLHAKMIELCRQRYDDRAWHFRH